MANPTTKVESSTATHARAAFTSDNVQASTPAESHLMLPALSTR
jgi:hypothetical protein